MNIVGMGNRFEAARLAVRNWVVYASSVQAIFQSGRGDQRVH